jgi:hypothetical protein
MMKALSLTILIALAGSPALADHLPCPPRAELRICPILIDLPLVLVDPRT